MGAFFHSLLRRLAVFAFAGLLTLAPANAQQRTMAVEASTQNRVALVIGNGAYRHAPRLPNPTNDAQNVAAALKRAGFQTVVGLDLDQAGMQDAAIRFARIAREADVALFYYSGHAMQYNGINYLMPVDAKLTDKADLRRLARVDDIMLDLQQAKNLKILVLDSCRDNPLAEELKRSIGRTRGSSIQRGLAKIESPQGTIVAYATQSNSTADDGRGRNSPYTSAFLRHIEKQAEIGAIFRRISADVYRATKGRQLPELSLSLIGEFYLKGRPASAKLPGTPTPSPCDGAASHWQNAKTIGTQTAFEDHLARFPGCAFATLARQKIVTLSAPKPDPCAAAEAHWRSTEKIGSKSAMEDHLRQFEQCPFANLAREKIAALSKPAVGGPFVPVRISLWSHNNSLMYLAADGASRKFYYQKPRPGMVSAGVQPGTLLFDGQKSGNRYFGTAYIFAYRCGKYPYQVSGYVLNDGRTVAMNGQAPRVNLSTCSVTGYRPDHLVFEFERLQ